MDKKIFVTSDTHFSQHNIIEYECRPYDDIEEMNRDIVKKWNETVSKDDMVYHLGDFGMASEDELKEIFKHLNGSISLIRGNHDDSITKLLNIGFNSVADDMSLDYMGYIIYFVHNLKPEIMIEEDGYLFLHGHSHSMTRFNSNAINVCSLAWGYKPVELKELIKLYRKYRSKTK